MRRAILTVVLTSLVIGVAGSASAFDGKRSGFILGFGLGLGHSSITEELMYYWGQTRDMSQTHDGICTDFRIGAGASKQVQIYWASKVAWFRDDLSDDITILGIGGVGATYFLKKRVPSFYLTGTLGFSSFGPISGGSGGGDNLGLGLAFGAGYEFAKHFSVEGNIIKGSPGEGNSAWGVRVTLNAIAY